MRREENNDSFEMWRRLAADGEIEHRLSICLSKIGDDDCDVEDGDEDDDENDDEEDDFSLI